MKKYLTAAVVVGALGYLVDIYDLVLFSIVRKSSLLAIGVTPEHLLGTGILLINSQMTGMLVGGVLWGVLGDRWGRVSVLKGSILIYSLANLFNAFVMTVPQYVVLRFIAGLGLAGEIGAAITLVSETLPKEIRGVGTTIIATFGMVGAIIAGLIGEGLSWRVAYAIGGALGLLLLSFRVSMKDSALFTRQKALGAHVIKGSFLMLFKNRVRALKFLACIAMGVPVWYAIGLIFTFSPEIAHDLNVRGEVLSAYTILFGYLGLLVGDLVSGFLSQIYRTRIKVIFGFLVFTLLLTASLPYLNAISAATYYTYCFLLGGGIGYWALFVSTTAEQFGTNLRATVATSIPNFVRGSVVPLTLLFQVLMGGFFSLSRIHSALAVGGLSLAIAFFALYHLPETFARDLDFLES